MVIASAVLAALAALLHVYIFFMESLAWEGPAARKTFGPATSTEVEITRSFAFNQGFYNLFLAIVTLIGVVFLLFTFSPVGPALVFVGTGSMLAAAIVLFAAFPDKRQAAIKQGTLPLLAVIATIIAVAS